jgi:hypothetical protein
MRHETHRRSGCSDSSCSSEASAWAIAAGGTSDSPRVFIPRPLISPEFFSPESILEWNFDTISVHTMTGGRSISFIADQMFKLNTRIQEGNKALVKEILSALKFAEKNYNTTAGEAVMSYHNAIHGADVLQAFHFISRAVMETKSPVEILACFFAAALHDLDHLGVSNQFLINTQHPLAVEHQNSSVLERHHIGSALRLVDEYLHSLEIDEKRLFKNIVTEMILSTDLANHHDLLSRFTLTGEDQLSVLLHAADMSSCARPWPIASRWTDRLMDEFFLQGDRERELGWEVTPMMDRQGCSVPRVQLGFIDVIARPLMTLLAQAAILEEIERNRAIWESMERR